MKKASLLCTLIVLFIAGNSCAIDGKTMGHIISIPIIEGTGIYSSVKMIQTHDGNLTAAAITNLSLIGLNAGLGAVTLFGGSDNYSTLRTIHRIMGFSTFCAGAWMTASAVANKDVSRVDKGVSMGYSVLTVVPLFMFSF